MAGTRTAIGRQAPRPARAMGNLSTLSGSPGYRSKPEVERLKKQVAILSARVAELEREAEAARDLESDNVIVLRDIAKEQARKEILEAFAADEPLDHADLAEDLRLEISLVFEVCNELIDEGLVVFHADNRN